MTWTTWQYNTSYFARKYGQKLKLDKFQVDFTLIMGAMYWLSTWANTFKKWLKFTVIWAPCTGFLRTGTKRHCQDQIFVIKCNSVSVQVIRVLHPG